MGIMPHRDIDRALKLVLGLDIPFWPQLPQISFYEDMYVQFSQHFPGIVVDAENKKLHLDSARFQGGLADYSEKNGMQFGTIETRFSTPSGEEIQVQRTTFIERMVS